MNDGEPVAQIHLGATKENADKGIDVKSMQAKHLFEMEASIQMAQSQ